MTAAAGAARGAAQGGPVADAPLLGWALIIVGGLVEGVALGLAQSTALRASVPRLDRGRWMLATVVVAGLGWAAVSAQAALSDPDAGPDPGWLVVVGGAAGLGLVMGAVLGAAQAWSLRGAAARPWRWVGVSSVAWTPAMVLIFLGATTTPGAWSFVGVLAAGAVTGAVAGGVLGAVIAALLPARGPGAVASPTRGDVAR